jgi:hypothetical protein
MSHATYIRGNQVDSWLLVVRNQTDSLTHGLSFDHNLCFICPNGSCETKHLRFNIFSMTFWTNEFWPLQLPFEDLGVHLGCESSFPHILCILGSMWCYFLASLLARNLASPCFNREPKVRIAIVTFGYLFFLCGGLTIFGGWKSRCLSWFVWVLCAGVFCVYYVRMFFCKVTF